MTVVYAAQAPPPPPPPKAFQSPSMTWMGWNGGDPATIPDSGSQADAAPWNLLGDDIALLDDGGLSGMHFPQFADFVSEYVGLDGQRFRGGRTTSRQVNWTIRLRSRQSSAHYLERESAFWRSFHPKRYGQWKITQPTGLSRWMLLRLQSDGGFADGPNPVLFGRNVVPVQLLADQPYWRGETIRKTWTKVSPVPFFGVDGLLHISRSSSTDGAVITNPGDVPEYATWTITAITGAVVATIMVDGSSTTTPSIPEGKTLIIRTDPQFQSAHMGTLQPDGTLAGDTKVTGQMSSWSLKGIPDGADVPIGFTLSGYGSVTAEIGTRYFRARG